MAVNNFVVEVTKYLEQYNEEVDRATKAAAKEAAEVTVRELKSTSPKRKGGKGKGKYARGWTYKKQELGINMSYVVYNKGAPGLTHLLERGHVIRNQSGSWGRIRAIPHIARAAEAGIQRFELGIRARLRG